MDGQVIFLLDEFKDHDFNLSICNEYPVDVFAKLASVPLTPTRELGPRDVPA
jgi:hypothetical protein